MSELLTLSPPPTAKKKILLEDFEYKKRHNLWRHVYCMQNFQKISSPPTKKNQLLPEKTTIKTKKLWLPVYSMSELRGKRNVYTTCKAVVKDEHL